MQTMMNIEKNLERLMAMKTEHPGDLSVLMSCADTAMMAGRYLTASHCYQQVLEGKPGHMVARLSLARVFMIRGLLPEAAREVLAVLDLYPHNLEAHLLSGIIGDRGIPADMVRRLAAFKELSPDTSDLPVLRRMLELEREEASHEMNEYRGLAHDRAGDLFLEASGELARRRRDLMDKILENLAKFQEGGEEVRRPRLAVDPGRRRRFEAMVEELAGRMAPLSRTKGVNLVWVVSSDGMLGHHLTRESIDVASLLPVLTRGLGRLAGWNPSTTGHGLQYWVVECNQGLMAVRSLVADFYLVVVGGRGINFGVLRYTLDKNQEQLCQLLAMAGPTTENAAGGPSPAVATADASPAPGS